MVKSEQHRQKKLARRKAKDQRAKRQLIQQKQQLASLMGKMTAASSGKIVHCAIGEIEAGMGMVLISRQAPTGQIAVAVFLLDLFCLGVKNAMGTYYAPSQYNDMYDDIRTKHMMKSARPEVARGLVEAAIEYAENLGFSPHADYRKMQPIWGDVEPQSIEGLYEFGENGKPTYVSGPMDDSVKQRRILETLTHTVGEGNFKFVLMGDMGDAGFLPHFDNALPGIEQEDEETHARTVEGTVTSQRIDAAE